MSRTAQNVPMAPTTVSSCWSHVFGPGSTTRAAISGKCSGFGDLREMRFMGFKNWQMGGDVEGILQNDSDNNLHGCNHG